MARCRLNGRQLMVFGLSALLVVTVVNQTTVFSKDPDPSSSPSSQPSASSVVKGHTATEEYNVYTSGQNGRGWYSTDERTLQEPPMEQLPQLQDSWPLENKVTVEEVRKQEAGDGYVKSGLSTGEIQEQHPLIEPQQQQEEEPQQQQQEEPQQQQQDPQQSIEPIQGGVIQPEQIQFQSDLLIHGEPMQDQSRVYVVKNMGILETPPEISYQPVLQHSKEPHQFKREPMSNPTEEQQHSKELLTGISEERPLNALDEASKEPEQFGSQEQNGKKELNSGKNRKKGKTGSVERMSGKIQTDKQPVLQDNSRATPNISSQVTTEGPLISSSTESYPPYSVPYVYSAPCFLCETDLCPHNGSAVKVVILVTSAPAHFEQRLTVRHTWGSFSKRKDVKVAFMLGKPAEDELIYKILHESDVYGDVIIGDFMDAYQNLTLKTMFLLKYATQFCSEAKFLLKTDDDVFINVDNLLKLVNEHIGDKYGIWGAAHKKLTVHRNKKDKYFIPKTVYRENEFPLFLAGPAYIMTKDTAAVLHENAEGCEFFPLEDVFFTGIVAEKLKVPKHVITSVKVSRRKIKYNMKDIIAIHEQDRKMMFKSWNAVVSNMKT